MIEDWRSAALWAAEAKALGIDRKIMPHSERNVREKADRESWPFRERQQSGGGREYPLSALPAALKKALANQVVKVEKPLPPAQLDLALPRIEDMKDYQKKPLEARAVLLAELDRMVLTGHKLTHAMQAMAAAAARGELAPELQRLVPIANARSGDGRALSVRSLKRWLSDRRRAGGKVEALAPKAVPEAPVQKWAATFMRLYCRPMKPTITEVLEDLWPAGEAKPSYDQAKRFLRRVDAITKSKGRLGPKALQTMKAYTARDVSELWPGAVFIGDGHTHKSRVAHPIHGGPFRPEVTAILDVYTRKWVGWSAALAENTWAVADSLRHALTTTTCCDIFYYDNGSGANNKTWDDDCTGMAARQGFTKLNSAPWSSQARGIIERFHSSVLHRVARRSISYVGQRMDDEARQRVYKLTEQHIKESGQSPLLPSWADFIAEIDAEMERYNTRPHDGLPKIIDPATGKRRHMTPNEAWDKAVADGWTPDPLSAEDARTLFRPAVRRKVSRELVSWAGNDYHAPELETLHGEWVMVAYDIHDATSVSVSLLDGRHVCEAKWDGHKTSYVPVTFAQSAHEKRVANRLKLNDRRRDKIMLEAGPTRTIEHQPAETFTPEILQAAEAEYVRLETKAAATDQVPIRMAGGRPTFADDVSWARWVLENPQDALDEDRSELRRKLRNRSFRMLLEVQGLDVGALSALAA
jgi:putative transposase